MKLMLISFSVSSQHSAKVLHSRANVTNAAASGQLSGMPTAKFMMPPKPMSEASTHGGVGGGGDAGGAGGAGGGDGGDGSDGDAGGDVGGDGGGGWR